MTNRQLDMENIDRVDNLVYTPLEKRYLQARIVGTVLAYAGLMVHVAWPGLLLALAAPAGYNPQDRPSRCGTRVVQDKDKRERHRELPWNQVYTSIVRFRPADAVCRIIPVP